MARGGKDRIPRRVTGTLAIGVVAVDRSVGSWRSIHEASRVARRGREPTATMPLIALQPHAGRGWSHGPRMLRWCGSYKAPKAAVPCSLLRGRQNNNGTYKIP